MMDDVEYKKNQQKRAARKLQKETGIKYTQALRKIKDLDEFGIPLGEHVAVCGCRFNGRSLMKACDEHLHSLSYPDFSFSIELPKEK